VLTRSRLVADAAAATPPQELDDFADALVELDVGGAGKPVFVYADRRCATPRFGYIPPGLDGARMLRSRRRLRLRAQDLRRGSPRPST
jgi:hypothetical protein